MNEPRLSDRLRRLVDKYDGKAVPFTQLPEKAQFFFTNFHARSAAWRGDLGLLKGVLTEQDSEIGYVEIPIWELRREMLQDKGAAESFDDFESLYQWFPVAMLPFDPEWGEPVLLSDEPEGTLLAGYKTFMEYHRKSAKNKEFKIVPCLYHLSPVTT